MAQTAHRRILAISGVVALVLAPAPAGAATLGRGLEQLVALYETHNVKLSSALRIHLTAPNGDVLVHVRLDPSHKRDTTLAQLASVGFRLSAVSELDPSLAEGYLSLSTVRAAA